MTDTCYIDIGDTRENTHAHTYAVSDLQPHEGHITPLHQKLALAPPPEDMPP
eukprot:COSAG06_NODE_1714_length_8624_cov_12.847977_3_plen_51_part_01